MGTKTKYFSNTSYWHFYLISFISVFIGGFIYILLRPVKASFFKLLNLSGFEKWVDSVREVTVPISESFPNWFVYTFPNGLWAFAYTVLMLALWKGNQSPIKYFWFTTIPFIVFGFELLQLTGTIPGTFAFDDILSGFLGIITGVLITKLYRHEKSKV